MKTICLHFCVGKYCTISDIRQKFRFFFKLFRKRWKHHKSILYLCLNTQTGLSHTFTIKQELLKIDRRIDIVIRSWSSQHSLHCVCIQVGGRLPAFLSVGEKKVTVKLWQMKSVSLGRRLLQFELFFFSLGY